MDLNKRYNIIKYSFIAFIYAIAIAFGLLVLAPLELGLLFDLGALLVLVLIIQIIGNGFINHYMYRKMSEGYTSFRNSLELVDIKGIKELHMQWLKVNSKSPRTKERMYINVYNVSHFNFLETSDNPNLGDYVNEILENNSNTFSYQVLIILEDRVVSLLENGQVDLAYQTLQKKLNYIEHCVDNDYVPEAMLESLLDHSSALRFMIDFMDSPNERKSERFFKKMSSNYTFVYTAYFVARVYIENNMKKEANMVAKKVQDLTGDFRLLKALKDYVNEQ